jgi:L-ascorbate metabolism protein UlaG (beta-lactamase superfamily)
VGYVLEAESLRFYVAGDTDATPEAAAVRCDVALLPIGGTYTMDPAEAAALANRIRPQVVIPIHYGSVAGSPEDFARFAAAVDPAIRVVRVI